MNDTTRQFYEITGSRLVMRTSIIGLVYVGDRVITPVSRAIARYCKCQEQRVMSIIGVNGAVKWLFFNGLFLFLFLLS